MDPDISALRQSLLSRMHELRTNRPPDAEVELMFADLMNRRDLLGGPGAPPPEALNNMFEFTMEKKWKLVYNDLLTMQGSALERPRRFVTNNASSASSSTPMVLVRNSPEWFIKKFMDNSVTTKHIESLAVTLRTCAIGWLQSFVEAKGTHVLSSYLLALQTRGTLNEQDLSQEYEVLKAFRSLFNSKPGAHDALQHPKCICGIARSLVSHQLSTRKQASDILLFLCHWEKPRGHSLVLQGIDELRVAFDRHGRFDAWFSALEAAIDGRGRMGSLVGASDEVRRLQLSAMPEAGLPEYVVNNMFLVNALVNSDIVDSLQARVHLRSQMTASGLPRIMAKMRELSTPDLDVQMSVYEKNAAADQEEMMESFHQSTVKDLNDPQDVFRLVMDRVQDSRAKDFFMSALQHLLFIQRDGADLVHFYQLIDSMISTVVMDRDGAATNADLESLMGTSLNNVLDRFADQDLLERLQHELKDAHAFLRSRDAEITQLKAQIHESAGGLVGHLQTQIRELQHDLDLSRENTISMQQDMDEMERSYVDRILGLELELRESTSLLRQAQDTKQNDPSFSHFNRQVLRDSLERQVERSRTIRKLVSNSSTDSFVPLDTAAPNSPNAVLPSPRVPPRSLSRNQHADQSPNTTDVSDRIGRAAMRTDTPTSLSPGTDSVDAFPSSNSSLDESNEWGMQAILATRMARNSDMQERMRDVRAARIRRRGDTDEGSSQDGTPSKGPVSQLQKSPFDRPATPTRDPRRVSGTSGSQSMSHAQSQDAANQFTPRPHPDRDALAPKSSARLSSATQFKITDPSATPTTSLPPTAQPGAQAVLSAGITPTHTPLPHLQTGPQQLTSPRPKPPPAEAHIASQTHVSPDFQHFGSRFSPNPSQGATAAPVHAHTPNLPSVTTSDTPSQPFSPSPAPVSYTHL